MGLSDWDTRLNANSTYFEALGTAGLCGLVALLGAGALALRGAISGATASGASGLGLVAAIVLAATAVHGVLDAFLVFSTPLFVVAAAMATGLLYGASK